MNEPDARLRAHRGGEPAVRLYVTSATLKGLGRASWNAAAEHPSALDYLLAAVATDLVSGLFEEAGRELQDVELRLEAFLENPLVVARVVGEEGSPRVARIRGSLYVHASEGIRDAWQRARQRSPVLASLAPETRIDIELKELP
jgi:hypothetical protein